MNNENNVLPDNPSINVIKAGQSGIFTNYIYKAIPLAFDESMSYYETLLGLLDYLKNTVIPTVNNNADAVVELQNLYTELHDYVEHYFDNLDVQQEINNKLDEMAESGQLTDIIAQYLGLAGMITFNNVAEMKLAENLVNGSKCATLGYYNVNDDGKSFYKVRTITNDDVVDESLIIALYDNSLVAELVCDNEVNIKQLGAKGDNSNNDTNYFKIFANSNINTLYMPKGTYKINDIIDLENKNLIGIGNPTINIFGITTSREHTIHIVGETNIKDVKFELNVANTNILGFFGSNNCIIENCDFKVNNVACNGYVDIYTDNKNVRFLNCNFNCSSLDTSSVNTYGGVWVRELDNTKETSDVIFDNCKFYHRSRDEIIACWNTNGHLHNVQINNCILEASPLATSPNLLRFDCEHSSVNNCIIIYKPSDNDNRSTVINASDANYETSFNNCVFDLNTNFTNGIGHGSKLNINNCFITNNKLSKLGRDCTFNSCKFKLFEFQQQASIKIYNSEFNVSQKDGWSFAGADFTINNCIFNYNACTSNDFILLLNDNGTITIKDSIINAPTDVTKIRIGNFGSHTAYLKFVNNIIPSLNIGNGSNMSGIVANNICYNTITESSYFTYNNNFDAS